MTKGRTPPARPGLTLPESGIEVQIHPFGRMTLDEISKAARKELPEPVPPMNTVTGLDGLEHDEPNPADPEYVEAIKAHEEALQANVVKRMLGVMQVYAVDYEVDTEQVARFRKGMEAGGMQLAGDDREVYFYHFVLNADEDAQALIAAVMRRSQPTEEAITEQVAAF